MCTLPSKSLLRLVPFLTLHHTDHPLESSPATNPLRHDFCLQAIVSTAHTAALHSSHQSIGMSESSRQEYGQHIVLHCALHTPLVTCARRLHGIANTDNRLLHPHTNQTGLPSAGSPIAYPVDLHQRRL